MSGEQDLVNILLAELDENGQQNGRLNNAYTEDILFMALLNRVANRRTATDILHQVQYHLTYKQKNLGDDEFVVTRGC